MYLKADKTIMNDNLAKNFLKSLIGVFKKNILSNESFVTLVKIFKIFGEQSELFKKTLSLMLNKLDSNSTNNLCRILV